MTKEKRATFHALADGSSKSMRIMTRLPRLGTLAAIAALITTAIPVEAALAQQTSSIGQTRGASGLQLPRFVSLKARRVNMRVGPGRDYAVDWLFLKSGVPIEITQEYGNWMRVRDPEGAEGWIFRSLLSGKRTAIAAPWNKGKDLTIGLYDKPDVRSRLNARIEPGVTGRILSCDGDWCRVDFGKADGWMKQSRLWGAYPGEIIED